MDVRSFIEKYDEPSFFKELLKMGAGFSIDEIFVKCDSGGSVTVRLKPLIKDYAANGVINLNCPKGKESKFSLKELFSSLSKDESELETCPLCNQGLLLFKIRVGDLSISYHKVHVLFEYPSKVKDDGLISELITAFP